MKQLNSIFCIIILISIIPLFIFAGERAPGSKWAFIICIDEYQDEALSHTSYSVQYGREMAGVLQQLYGYEADHILQLYDNLAVESAINEGFYQLIKQMRRNDSLFLLLMTQVTSSERGGNFLVPYDGAVDKPWTLISFDDMLNFVRKLSPEQTFIMLGECLEEPFQQVERLEKIKYELPNFQFLSYRCFDPNEEEEIALTFNGSLINVLKGKENITDRFGEISVSRLVEYLQEKHAMPGFRVNLFSGMGRSDFVFVPSIDDRSTILYPQLSPNFSIRERMNAISELVLVTIMADPQNSGEPTARLAVELTEIIHNPTENINVRNRAVWALGELKFQASISELSEIFANSSEKSIQESAFEALTKFGTDEVKPFLRQALKSDESGIRIVAVHAISDARDRESMVDLMILLQDDNSVDVRVSILESIVRFAPLQEGELNTIRGLLQDRFGEIRKHAVNTLNKLNDQRSVPALLRMLSNDEDASVRKECAYALGKMHRESNRELIYEALTRSLKKDKNDDVREATVFAIGQLGGSDAEKILNKVLKDDDEAENIIKISAEQLGRMKSSKAVEPLTMLLKHHNPLIRHSAVKALGMIGDDRAARPLLYMLKDEEQYVRVEAEKALQNIEITMKNMSEQGELIPGLSDPSPNVRAQSAEKLAQSGDPSVVPYLVNMLADDEMRVREQSIELLTRFQDEVSLEYIVKALDDENFLKRQGAALVLGFIGNPSVVNSLLAHQKDPSSVVRAEVIMALGHIADDRCIAPVINAFSDYDEMVRVSAAAALSVHIFRGMRDERHDFANELAQEGQNLTRRVLANDHPWTIWYNVLNLQNEHSDLKVKFDLNATDNPDLFSYQIENSGDTDVQFALLGLAVDDRIRLLNPQFSNESATLSPGEIHNGSFNRLKLECEVCKLFVYTRPFNIGFFEETRGRYQKMYRSLDPFSQMLMGQKAKIEPRQWLTVQRVLP